MWIIYRREGILEGMLYWDGLCEGILEGILVGGSWRVYSGILEGIFEGM